MIEDLKMECLRMALQNANFGSQYVQASQIGGAAGPRSGAEVIALAESYYGFVRTAAPYAAADMLKALEDAISCLEGESGEWGAIHPGNAVIRRGLAAIAKAKQ